MNYIENKSVQLKPGTQCTVVYWQDLVKDLKKNSALPDAIANDPFFARLLKSAENYAISEKRPKKRKGREVEDCYDTKDPFIDDSELTFMDGHFHAKESKQKKRKVVLGDSNTEKTTSIDPNIQNEQGKIVLDLECFDRASTDDFYVYFGTLSEPEEEDQLVKEQKKSSNIQKPKTVGNQQKTIVDKERKSTEKPINKGMRQQKESKKMQDYFNPLTPDKTVLNQKSIPITTEKNSLKNHSTLPTVHTVTNYYSYFQTIPLSKELEIAINNLLEQNKPGVITDKKHFPYILKEPLRKLCILAINRTLDYESKVLEIYPIPQYIKPTSKLNLNTGVLPNALLNTDPDKVVDKTQLQAFLDNQILQWEAASDLVDISNIYSRLVKHMPWNRATIRRIISKLLGKDVENWKRKQLKIIENCMRARISNVLETNNNSPVLQKDEENKTKFAWTTVIRHLLHQYIKVYLEIFGITLNPLQNEETAEERSLYQRLRKDAYIRLMTLWPENMMTMSILSREYSKRKQSLASRMRRSMGTVANSLGVTKDLGSQSVSPKSRNLGNNDDSSMTSRTMTVDSADFSDNRSVKSTKGNSIVPLLPTVGKSKNSEFIVNGSSEKMVIDLESPTKAKQQKKNGGNDPKSNINEGNKSRFFEDSDDTSYPPIPIPKLHDLLGIKQGTKFVVPENKFNGNMEFQSTQHPYRHQGGHPDTGHLNPVSRNITNTYGNKTEQNGGTSNQKQGAIHPKKNMSLKYMNHKRS
ncbi:hypothetical protein BB559_002107 [Furculomyces boomerangus]|uniref:Ubinuclein middle domain-containing protein n=1 Tax=Furculomyces boomerangus TaxID=61424 RepID=A0A2T9YY52_9FUNG|nr:hypothetical protein BB559_002107 [Furculomyces boomerangus]